MIGDGGDNSGVVGTSEANGDRLAAIGDCIGEGGGGGSIRGASDGRLGMIGDCIGVGGGGGGGR